MAKSNCTPLSHSKISKNNVLSVLLAMQSLYIVSFFFVLHYLSVTCVAIFYPGLALKLFFYLFFYANEMDL